MSCYTVLETQQNICCLRFWFKKCSSRLVKREMNASPIVAVPVLYFTQFVSIYKCRITTAYSSGWFKSLVRHTEKWPMRAGPEPVPCASAERLWWGQHSWQEQRWSQAPERSQKANPVRVEGDEKLLLSAKGCGAPFTQTRSATPTKAASWLESCSR